MISVTTFNNKTTRNTFTLVEYNFSLKIFTLIVDWSLGLSSLLKQKNLAKRTKQKYFRQETQ